MATGTLDANGVWQYGEDDNASLFSTMLAKLTGPLSTKLATLQNKDAVVAFVPTWTNFTLGNGTQSWTYARIGGRVFVSGVVTFGSTSVMGTSPYFSLPLPGLFTNSEVLGSCLMNDSGTRYWGTVHYDTVAVTALPRRLGVSGANIIDASITPTAPFTWGVGDQFSLNYSYRAA